MTDRMLAIGLLLLIGGCGEGGGGGLAGSGVSGSTSRFAIVGEHLYVLNQFKSVNDDDQDDDQDRFFSPRLTDSLDTFSLENRETPAMVDRMVINRATPETLHAVGENLFVGTSSGMQIVSLSDPAKPTTLSFTGHFTARDPVVVSGTTAYVTLRTGEATVSSAFNRSSNELQIYDVQNLENPVQLSTFAMTAPWGLGVRHGRAYICDGSSGLRVLTVADPLKVQPVAAVETDICFDLIVTESLLVSTGLGGVTQYRIDPATNQPVQLSKIALQ